MMAFLLQASTVRRRALALILALAGALAGCGGGDPAEDPHASAWGDPAMAIQAPPPALADRLRQAQGVAVGPGDAGTALTNADLLFAHAERVLPEYFPGPSTTLKEGAWLYRSYFATGVMLGVNANVVYVLGGPFGTTPARVGLVSDFVTTNAAPVARAGSAQNVTVGSTVTLDGSASSDANNDPLTYSWTLSSRPSGSTASLRNPTTAKPTFVPDVAGSYVVQLTVRDGKVNSTPASVTITATAPTGIAALYGRLTFSFFFTGGSGTIYTETANFSQVNLEDDGSLISFLADGRPIICSTMPSGTYRFFCVSSFPNGDSDNFLFNVTNGSVSGLYEFCTATQSASQCANDLLSTHDGPLSGTLTKLSSSLAAATDRQPGVLETLAGRLIEKARLAPPPSLTPGEAALALAAQRERLGLIAARVAADPLRQRP